MTVETFIVLVTGGRRYGDAFRIWTALDCLHWQRPISHLMHGGASGTDSIADAWARHRGVQPVKCDALWQYFGQSAGPRRNTRMAQLAPDMVLAFPGRVGTAGMVQIARELKLEVREVLIESE